MISKDNIEAVYPLSPMQEGMLFHTLHAPASGFYILQQHCVLRGELDLTSFKRAWQEVIRRHSVLRTAFFVGEKMAQVALHNVPVPLATEDWSGLDEAGQQRRLQEYLRGDRERGFDLAEAPLMRLCLIKIGERSHYFISSSHHALLDGWSCVLLLQELTAYYEAYSRGENPRLPAPRPYGDYIAWQRQQNADLAEAFWRRTLRDFRSPAPLPFATGELSSTASYQRSEMGRLLPSTAGSALRGIARQRQLTLSSILQGAWSLVLARHSGRADVVFGATVSGRPTTLAGVERMVGLFINSLPVRAEIAPDERLVTFLHRLQNQQIEAQEYAYTPLVDIQGWSEVPRGTPLFECTLAFENYPREFTSGTGQGRGATASSRLVVDRLRIEHSLSYPLCLIVEPSGSLQLTLVYDPARFTSAAIECLLDHLQAALETFEKKIEQRVGEVDLLTGVEREQVLVEWNRTKREYGEVRLVRELFEDQASHTPDAVALVYEDHELSYGRLNESANRLAHYLLILGIGPEVRVAVCMERGIEAVVAILAVLKAGGAYVPLDPTHPPGRLLQMLEDSQAVLILTQERLRGRLPAYWSLVVNVDTHESEWGEESADNPGLEVDEHNLAYVIYTSGSTGRPKGVCIEHSQLVNYVRAVNELLSPEPRQRMALVSTLAADLGYTMFYPSLCLGGELHVVSEDCSRDARMWEEYRIRRRLEYLKVTPMHVEGLVENGEALPGKALVLGGETCSREWVKWAVREWGCEVVNHYGPTECTVGAVAHKVDDWEEGPVPIGKPLANMRAYVADREVAVPIGAPGELYIGGGGVGRGYLNDPALTAERFVPDGLSGEKGARLYRTGDRACWRPDGELDFLGRVDRQVKLRGHRIEPGEVETALCGHSALKQCVVCVNEGDSGEKQLVAYVVAQGEEIPPSAELTDYLRGKLPDHMVPSIFVSIPELPLTSNGKLNREALPAPTRETGTIESQAPRTPVEGILAGIWAEVLKLKRVGVHENFFELGGHSLMATQVISRVRDSLGIDLPLRVVFESPTVARMAEEVDRERRGGGEVRAAIKPVGRDGELQLSFSQQRLWFIHQLEPASPAYNVPRAVRLNGRLSFSALGQSLEEIARRHEVLRTRFIAADGRPIQVIDELGRIELRIWDLTGLTEDEREAQARIVAAREALRPFDLQGGPVWRGALAEMAAQHHVLLLSLHHVASDGWSTEILVRELTALYEALQSGCPSPLPELPLQYADFATWQREWLQGEVLEQELAYWKQQLFGVPVLELPTDRPRPAVLGYAGARAPLRLSAELTAELTAFSRREGVTLFMTLVAAYQMMLGRYSGQRDAAVGALIANRNRLETEGLIGFFINQLALRMDLSGSPILRELMRRVREATLGAYDHQEIPFEKLVEELSPERDLARAPLCQAMFIFQNSSSPPSSLANVVVTPFRQEFGAVRFDVELVLAETEREVTGGINYNTDLFDGQTIARMANHLTRLLEAIIREPEKRIDEFVLLTAAEEWQLRGEWNDTKADYPVAQCVHGLFEEQAQRGPDAVAVGFRGDCLTYAELNRQADLLGRALAENGVGPEVTVGVLAHRGIELLVSMIGIFKAGGVYVPLDPFYPLDRLRRILRLSRSRVILIGSGLNVEPHALLDQPAVADRPSVLEIRGLLRPREAVANLLLSGCGPGNLAYVIFTSGSTGQPKGAMIEHQGMLNHLFAKITTLDLGSEETTAQTASQSFDISIWQFLAGLLVGGRIEIVDDEEARTPSRLLGEVIEKQLSILEVVPSMLLPMLEEVERRAEAGAALSALKALVVTGEALPPELCRRWSSRCSSIPILNAYGPTECSDDVTQETVERGCDDSEIRVPIGRPLSNTRAYLMDGAVQLAPIGVEGELWIGGDGVGRGYFNDGAQTARCFIPDSLGTDAGARLYMTGDRARRRPDGRIEFLGRIDHQVKVRGNRIELGEIEAALTSHPGVREAAVAAVEHPKRGLSLVGYVALKDGPGPSTRELQAFLRDRLPEYMAPQAFVTLDRLPLTPNGKIDRKALPAPPTDEAAGDGERSRSAMQEIVAGVWADVLKLERVGVSDNFFELGGHSLLATQVVSRIREALAVELPLRALFESPTVAGLADHVERERLAGSGPEAPPIRPVARNQELPLSFSQQRLWFIHQLEPDSPAYNLPYAVRLQGPLDIPVLMQCLEEVERRHEVLRTRFEARDGRPRQVIDQAEGLDVALHDASDLDAAEREQRTREIARLEAARPFDLEKGPVWRASLLRMGTEDHVLMVSMHHVVGDYWSAGVLVNETAELYAAFAEGAPSHLPELPVQYADFAVWQKAWLQGEVLEEQMGYWKRRLAGTPSLELPTDRLRLAAATHAGALIPFRLSPELTGGLKRFSRRQGVTLFMTLMAGLQALFGRYSVQEDGAIGTLIANRNRLEIEGLIGFFINQLALRMDLAGTPTVRELLRRVREATLGAYAHQDLPFEKLVEELAPERDLAREPLCQTLFIFQNAPEALSQLPDVAITRYGQDLGVVRFDVELTLMEVEEEVAGVINYNAELFDAQTISRLATHLRRLFEALVEDPDRRVADLGMLTAAEEWQLTEEWNDTDADYPMESCLHDLFEDQAKRVPDAAAVSFQDRWLTYAELSRRAGVLAGALAERGVTLEAPVAVLANRGIELLIAMLAVFKAGGVYVPLDPLHPMNRLRWLSRMAKSRVILATAELQEKARSVAEQATGESRAVLAIEDLLEGATVAHGRLSIGDPRNLAYVIFTSGSTGMPKGAMIEHGGMLNHLYAKISSLLLDETDIIAQTASQGFDISIWQFMVALVVGGRVHVIDDDHAQVPARLLSHVGETGVSVLEVVPSLLRPILDEVEDAEAGKPALPALRVLVATGEALPVELCRSWLSKYPDIAILNAYGPTECSDDVTQEMIECVPGKGETRIPIGRPLSNTRTYVVDAGGRHAPIGVEGELSIGGDGVGRGYFENGAETANSFIPDGYGRKTGARLYRTGDRARFRPDGRIDFLGRIDNQVKLRGYRIELGEIESVLRQYPAIEEAVVLAREDQPGDSRLVGYVVPRSRLCHSADPDSKRDLEHEQTRQWRQVFSQTYIDAGVADVADFNTAGWISSYTGQPLSAVEMRDWIDDTIARIMTRKPARVLEIGCGTGMLLMRIVPHCSDYFATDLSGAALDYVRKRLDPSLAPRVTLLERPADDFSGVAAGSFDAVILNSVIQYFPNIEYLVRVLEASVDAVSDGGFIFVGDVRSLQLLEAYHVSVESYMAPETMTIGQLRARLPGRITQEEELVVDSRFFRVLQHRFPRVASVQIFLKRGRHHNELTRFRYQVLINIGKRRDAPRVETLGWDKEKLSLPLVRNLIESHRPERLRITAVPNARLSLEQAVLEALRAGDDQMTVAAAQEAARNNGHDVDPEWFWDLGRQLGYGVSACWSDHDRRGRFDVTLSRLADQCETPAVEIACLHEEALPARQWDEYSNDPLRARHVRELAPNLKKWAEQLLPDYMTPSRFVVLDELPLTLNGKVDRRALPAPEHLHIEQPGLSEPPRTPFEEVLAAIWSQVLGIEPIGLSDNFFDLGGHSLLATQVISRVREALDVEVPLRALFESPTVAGLAEAVRRKQAAGIGVEEPPILPVGRDRELPLSFAQQRLWFIHQIEPESVAYSIPYSVRLRGALGVAVLLQCLEEISRRHEVLRTRFEARNGRPLQIIDPPDNIDLPVWDLTGLGQTEGEQQAREVAVRKANRPFDLERGPMWRAGLVKLGAEDHVLLLGLDHVVSDGWSLGVLIKEFSELYESFGEGRASSLPELPVQYADFATWQREWLQGEALERQMAYWRNRLAGMTSLELPTDRPRPSLVSHRGAHQSFRLSRELTREVAELSRREGVTMFMALMAGFQIVLGRYAAQNDVTVGTPIANRNRLETEALIGFFVNQLVLRTDLSGNPTFRQVLRRVREATLGAYAHQDVPFEKLVEELAPERRLGRTPLFQVEFVFQNAPQGDLRAAGIEFGGFSAEYDIAKFDLGLSVTNREEGVTGTAEYSTDLFEQSSIGRLLGHFRLALEAIVVDVGHRLGDLALLTQSERQRVLSDWNETGRYYGERSLAHEMFEAQSKRYPDAVAVRSPDGHVSYGALNERANRLAWRLMERGIGPESLVGVCFERSSVWTVGLLAILKAGAAYVSLDPGYPRERLAYMADKAAAPVLLTTPGLAAVIEGCEGSVLILDDELLKGPGEQSVDPPGRARSENPAYIVFTSGSMGRPKGVVISHGSLVNLIRWHQCEYGITRDDRASQVARIGFDASVWEIWPYLTAGAAINIVDEETRLSSSAVTEWLVEQQITIGWLPPILAEGVFAGSRVGQLPLRVLFSGSDRLLLSPPDHAQFEYINTYGPTEATVIVTFGTVPPESIAAGAPLIGGPLANTQIYLLDNYHQPAPIGAPGEIFIGGESLARGYLNDADQTASKFIPDSFGGKSGMRLYATGDLGRFREDGSIEFLGRKDDQVKIRGYRIELGEIEWVLSEHAAVGQCAVCVREDEPGHKRLVAYIAPRPGEPADVSDIRSHLQEKLPDYMVPVAYVMLDELPLTPNGKVDRRALPAPSQTVPSIESYVPPRTPAEQLLAAIWSRVLRVERVGITDNFFTLGGDSILSIQVVSRANEAGLRVTARQVFENQTISELAAAAGALRTVAAEQGVVSGEVPLTPVQCEFFEREVPKPHHFNQAVFLSLVPGFSFDWLDQAVLHLVSHHDALRLRFEKRAAGWRQFNAGVEEHRICLRVDLSQIPATCRQVVIDAAVAQVKASLDLPRGPLMRIVYFDLGREEPGRLLWVIHHLAVDGVSWRILLDDLETGYQQLAAGKELQWAPKTTSFRDWARRLTEHAHSADAEAELSYWRALQRPGVAPLPVEEDCAAQNGVVETALTREETHALLHEVPRTFRTRIKEVLLAALGKTLCAWTGGDAILIDLEAHGRQEEIGEADLSRTVGWFTSTYPVRLEMVEGESWLEALRRVKVQLSGIPHDGLGYGLLKHLSAKATVRAVLQSKSEVLFNYLGQFDQVVQESGLWQVAPEGSGAGPEVGGGRRHLLEINGLVANGQLRFGWSYSGATHRRETISELAWDYLARLRELIGHSQSPEAGSYIPSDFPEVNLSQEDLDDLLTQLQ